MRYWVIFLVILAIAVFLRFYQLGRIPAGVSDDEAVYIYSAYSIWKTGHDFAGKFLPLSFNFSFSYSPVPVYLLAPIVGLFGMNIFVGRFIYALAGTGTVILIYVLASQLFKRKSIALIAMAVVAVSPWNVFFSRTAYEAVFALFFFLGGIVLFLRGVKKGNILWSLPLFFFAFYSYHATKFFFLFCIPFLILLHWSFFIRQKRIFITFVIGYIFILASFLFVMKTQGVNRTDVLVWKDIQTASRVVDYERQRSTAPFWIRTIYSNKLMYYLSVIRQNYLEAFSPQFLFLYGETGGLAGLYGGSSHGVLYFIDLPLMFIGLFGLFANKSLRRSAIFVLGGLLLAPISSAVTTDRTYAVRSIMMQPFLVLIVGYGVYIVYSWIKARYASYWRVAVGVVAGTYLVFVGSYFYEYFYRFPIVNAEAWFQSTKELIEFIDHNKYRYDEIILASRGDPLFQYGFYNQMDPTVLRNLLRSPYPRRVGNVVFINECFQKEDPMNLIAKHSLYIVPERCHRQTSSSLTIKDKNEPLHVIWKIYSNNREW